MLCLNHSCFVAPRHDSIISFFFSFDHSLINHWLSLFQSNGQSYVMNQCNTGEIVSFLDVGQCQHKIKLILNRSTRSKTTVRSKRVGPLGSRWGPFTWFQLVPTQCYLFICFYFHWISLTHKIILCCWTYACISS